MVERSAAPAWLRWLLVFAALGFVTIGLGIEALRIAEAASCAERAQSAPLACPAPPGPYEIPLTLVIEIVVVAVAALEIVGSRR